ncbi:hypothetical protein MKX03_005172 [Papaver bracteatum]|nr:hypothetical protein MKX03_005172 [Papaver bracteatum]
MRPSSYSKRMKFDSFGTLQLTQTWHKYGLCPKGTILIRRKEKNYDPTLFRKHLSPSQPDNEGTHEKPQTETPTEISVSQIWVSVGHKENLNTIEVGWEVGRSIYGDDQPRFFYILDCKYFTHKLIYYIYFFSCIIFIFFLYTDNYVGSGCYNLLCEGFVHTTSSVALGCNFTELSTFNGSQKNATFSIHKDKRSGNWWIQLQGIPIGYYPSSLFSELSNTATQIDWGGEITNEKSKGRHTSTQMGSGHFPSEGGLNIFSYFNWVQLVDENNLIKDPQYVKKSVTNPNFYNLQIDEDHYDTNGYGFYYGGIGYNDKCK